MVSPANVLVEYSCSSIVYVALVVGVGTVVVAAAVAMAAVTSRWGRIEKFAPLQQASVCRPCDVKFLSYSRVRRSAVENSAPSE